MQETIIKLLPDHPGFEVNGREARPGDSVILESPLLTGWVLVVEMKTRAEAMQCTIKRPVSAREWWEEFWKWSCERYRTTSAKRN